VRVEGRWKISATVRRRSASELYGDALSAEAGKCTLAARVRVLTWNLFHGRAVPPAGHDLFDGFAAALGGWEWDVALLQEVPPWWPARLGQLLRADYRLVLTSRNALLPLRRAIAIRWPDVIKSNGGGCNAILVRARTRATRITEHRAARLCLLPERRWVHGVRLAGGPWACNLHTEPDPRQGRAAANVALEWSAGGPLVLGGDFNVHGLVLAGFTHAAGSGPDHVFVSGLAQGGPGEIPDRGRLSDHAPVIAEVQD
jgi:endonuclease/exonuclease/phosphatase family metal-dependent hydrolase